MSAAPDEANPPRPPAAKPAAGSDVHASVFIASTATVAGRMIAEQLRQHLVQQQLDAGAAAISIGARTNIQDNTIIRCATAQGVSIGRDSDRRPQRDDP